MSDDIICCLVCGERALDKQFTCGRMSCRHAMFDCDKPMTDTKNNILGREVHEQIEMRQKVNSLIAVLGFDIDIFERDLRGAAAELLDALEARLATEDDDEDARTRMLSKGGIKMIHMERMARLRARVAELETALKPFAREYTLTSRFGLVDSEPYFTRTTGIKVGDLRRAAEALDPKSR